MKLVDNIKASYTELVQRVTWPTRKELANNAVLVMIASLILALIVWLMDQLFEFIMFGHEGIFGGIYGLF